MSQFFIDRPVFAWVIAIFIALAGIVAIPQLPVARFPDIAPPSVSIFTSYAGADAQTVSDSVIRPIEKELSSVKNVLYYESTVDSTGGANITVTFRPGTDPDLAQVRVLLMTARGSVVEHRKGMALGADGFIAKPFELAELRAEMGRLLAVT